MSIDNGRVEIIPHVFCPTGPELLQQVRMVTATLRTNATYFVQSRFCQTIMHIDVMRQNLHIIETFLS